MLPTLEKYLRKMSGMCLKLLLPF